MVASTCRFVQAEACPASAGFRAVVAKEFRYPGAGEALEELPLGRDVQSGLTRRGGLRQAAGLRLSQGQAACRVAPGQAQGGFGAFLPATRR